MQVESTSSAGYSHDAVCREPRFLDPDFRGPERQGCFELCLGPSPYSGLTSQDRMFRAASFFLRASWIGGCRSASPWIQ